MHNAYGPYTKNHERIQEFRQTGDLKHLNRNELDKACFARNVAYSDSKNLATRIVSDKASLEKAYEIAANSK